MSVATKHRRLGSHDEMRSVALALTRPGDEGSQWVNVLLGQDNQERRWEDIGVAFKGQRILAILT